MAGLTLAERAETRCKHGEDSFFKIVALLQGKPRLVACVFDLVKSEVLDAFDNLLDIL